MTQQITPEFLVQQQIKNADKNLAILKTRAFDHAPHVTKSEFIAKLLPILERPFDKDNQQIYRDFCRMQRTSIYVVDDHDHNNIVHVIPSLFGSGIVRDDTMTLVNVLENSHKQAERNPDLWGKVHSFLAEQSLEQDGNYAKYVIYPILKILAEYDKTMLVPVIEDGTMQELRYVGKGQAVTQDDLFLDDDDNGLDYAD